MQKRKIAVKYFYKIGGGRIRLMLPDQEEYLTNAKWAIKVILLMGYPKNIAEKGKIADSGHLFRFPLRFSFKVVWSEGGFGYALFVLCLRISEG
jgi:hypothetical protein